MAKGSYKAPYKSGAKVGGGKGGDNRQTINMASTKKAATGTGFRPGTSKLSKVS